MLRQCTCLCKSTCLSRRAMSISPLPISASTSCAIQSGLRTACAPASARLSSTYCIPPNHHRSVMYVCHITRSTLILVFPPQHWLQLYGESSGNELYHVRLGDSKIFRDCAGLSFTESVYRSFAKEVCLIGVRNPASSSLELNPGQNYIMVHTLTYLVSVIYLLP